MKPRDAPLPCAEKLARASKLQIDFRNPEPVGGLDERAEASLGNLVARSGRERQAVGLPAPPSNSAAELVQLRQAETLRVLDHHHGGIGNVHPHFDDGRRNKDTDLTLFEA